MGLMLCAGATALNLQSSRSHAIFTIFLQRTMLEPVSERKQVSCSTPGPVKSFYASAQPSFEYLQHAIWRAAAV